ncbi:uncharacterized protein LACBIDRAFT_303253 [Laccaria bicolor S238N-H82]|uniref:Predicted protein n=1 Tax=Laccaria bicolor (strain S238N-H82 / ATCC MYA-4686) TaxID=486041 RepID=B0DJ78_LACBS|nr:uncharacterized protein LACBIDRAFT_303253 [Laccaria bicolor S238N-H82]EDR05473.1 predicted protein [Laccaria bicolor S238N-H82]|eukprot:XP_001884031.1 predicted protein [Laccaria bicolor S238N-H82]
MTSSHTTPTHPPPHFPTLFYQRRPLPICMRHPRTLQPPFPIVYTAPTHSSTPFPTLFTNGAQRLSFRASQTSQFHPFHNNRPPADPTHPCNARTHPSTPLPTLFTNGAHCLSFSRPINCSNPSISQTAPTAPFAFPSKRPPVDSPHPHTPPCTLPLPFPTLFTNGTQRLLFCASQTSQFHPFHNNRPPADPTHPCNARTHPSTPLSHPFHQRRPLPVVFHPVNCSNPSISQTAPTAPFAFPSKHPPADSPHPCTPPCTLPLPFLALLTNGAQCPSFHAQHRFAPNHTHPPPFHKRRPTPIPADSTHPLPLPSHIVSRPHLRLNASTSTSLLYRFVPHLTYTRPFSRRVIYIW